MCQSMGSALIASRLARSRNTPYRLDELPSGYVPFTYDRKSDASQNEMRPTCCFSQLLSPSIHVQCQIISRTHREYFRRSTLLQTKLRASQAQSCFSQLPTRTMTVFSAQKKVSDAGLLQSAPFIDNAFTTATDACFAVDNPSTGKPFTYVSSTTEEQVLQATRSAQKAFEQYARTTPQARVKHILALSAAVQAARDDLACLLTLENGKPFAEALKEVDYGASFLHWSAQPSMAATPGTTWTANGGHLARTMCVPVGVVFAVIPFNFPFALLLRKVAPALAAGCPVIAKPCPRTPLTALAFAALAQSVGLPSGLLSVLPAPAAESEAMLRTALESGLVKKVSFTGSSPAGKAVSILAASHSARFALELGGNAPAIVCDDADLDAAVRNILASKTRCSGQACVAVNRIFVQGGIADKFLAKLREAVRGLRVNDGFAEAVDIGPVVDAVAADRIRQKVAEAVRDGAKVTVGDAILQQNDSTGSMAAYVRPAVVEGVTDDMRVASEEIFGPIFPVLTFEDDDEVLQRSNNVSARLAAYVFTENLRRSNKLVVGLDFGMIGVNDVAVSDPATPFGGMNEAGVGREGGWHAVEAFTEMKYSITAT